MKKRLFRIVVTVLPWAVATSVLLLPKLGTQKVLVPLLALVSALVLSISSCAPALSPENAKSAAPVKADATAEVEQAGDYDSWRENYAYTLGFQAYVFGYPYVNMPAYRYAFVKGPYRNEQTPYAALNHFYHFRKLPDASYQGGGGTNNDTLYSTAWVDVSQEPVILSHPDMGDRYFQFQLVSFDSDNFAVVGKRLTGSRAGSFALIGPNWKGELPEGVTALHRSRTDAIFILGRTLVDNKEDALVVNKLQDQYTLIPLSYWGKPDAVLPESRDVWLPFDKKTDPLAEWKTMNRALAEFPPEERHKNLLDMFATIGVGPGLDVEKQDDATKRGLIRAANDAFKMIVDINKSDHPFLGNSRNGWDISPRNFGRLGLENDFLRRAAINFSGVCSTTPAEATYYQSNADANGVLYDGSKKYVLHFPPGTLPDVKAFWSVTMYSAASGTFNLVDNPIDRYSIGDRTPNVKKDADGGLTIYIGGTSPGADKESNWLPSPNSGPFTLTFRTYIPGKDIVDQKWFPPGLAQV